ncbi:MAG: hypothetical protein ACYTDW_12565 [Planctomycetota bacterium]
MARFKLSWLLKGEKTGDSAGGGVRYGFGAYRGEGQHGLKPILRY